MATIEARPGPEAQPKPDRFFGSTQDTMPGYGAGSSKGASGIIGYVVAGIILVAVLVALGIGIAVLVKVNKDYTSQTVIVERNFTVGVTMTPEPVTGTQSASSLVSTNPTELTSQSTVTSPVTVTVITTQPVTDTTQPPPIGIPPPPTISPNDPGYNASLNFMASLKSTMKLDSSVCNDFYNYSCGAIAGPSFFGQIQLQAIADVVPQLTGNYINNASILPMRQLKWYFEACKVAEYDIAGAINNGSYVKGLLALMQATTGWNFPAFNQGQSPSPVTANSLAAALGFLSGQLNIDTLLSVGIDTNWGNPHSSTSYAMYVDQPVLIYGNSIYRNAWTTYEPILRSNLTDFMNAAANMYSITLNQSQLANDVDAFLKLEYLLATTYSTPDGDRRKFWRMYNNYTIERAGNDFKFIEWITYMQNLTIYANDTVRAKVRDPQFAFIITETDMTRSLSDDIMNRKSPFTDRLLTNYLYMRYIYDYAGLIPPLPGMEKQHAETWKAKSVKVASSRVGRLTRRQLRHSEPLVFDTQNNNNRDEVEDQINLNCAQQTMFALPYANARAYEDARFPPTFPNPNTPRQLFRQKVLYIVESVLTAFRSQIDQLWWMSFASKQGAFGKIDYLVKNIGYPDWINSDNEMIRRHANLLIFEDQPYIAMALVINHWITRSDFDLLMRTNGIDRMEFNGPPDLVNAWYQPELNSITFPLAILQPPFFDMNYPWSANFGALGVVGGHELTHGFDDEGVQWDGVGVLSRDGWMDNSSSLAFDDMARCVIQQYGKFCPLAGTSFQQQCINGVQTQGENIADNGGMRAAYRAYRNHINVNGPDSQLPDATGVYNQFTHDQLFFLNFGQVWCQRPPSQEALSRQLLLDPHSPALYRVMGSIQNFPDWRAAYNCPNGTSVYAPNDGCQVWVSDIQPQRPPPTTTTTPAINVPTLPTSNNTDYSTSVNYFRASMNVSADPCNDFYSYACGSYNKPISFAVVDDINFHNQAVQIKHWELYEYAQTPQALRKTKAFFDACESSHQDYDASIANGSVVLQTLSDFAAFTGMTFSMIENQGSTLNHTNASTLGRAIGWLSDSWVDTLVTGFVDTNWKADDGDAYKVFFDQPSLFWGSLNYYAPDTWANYTQYMYSDIITDLFQRYAALRGVTLNADTLQTDVQSIMDFEMMLARDFCTDDTTRRKFDRNWNSRTLPNVNTNFAFISWTEYTAALTLSAPAIDFFSRTFIVMEPEKLTNMSRVFMAGTEFTGTQLVNYLFFRLLASQEEFLPDLNKGEQKMERQWQKPLLGAGRRILRTEKKRLPDKATTDDILNHCAIETVDYMMYANARFFIDFLYPTEEDRNRTRESARQIVTNILRSFRHMIADLFWMSDGTKVGAYAKVDNLQVNIAFPDFIMNNASLDAYYANLVFDPSDGFFSMIKKLQKFNRFLMFDYLKMSAVDRTDFLAPPGIVNAWYQPELNSITFPAGILQTPFFDRLWPSSVNYGGLGLVAGHELTHGFDDEGVQWNGTGILNPWMDQSSADGFQRMADCVIQEYSGFCPLNASQYTPNCVNGAQTQGENIADNGGIHASFQSYRRHVSLFGPDLNMPDPLLGQFSHDQLYFLSFGQTWCRAPPSQAAIYRQLMVDVHSPAEFRIFGTIQNFPEFRNTFKCPRGSAYGPNQHCNVWVLDNTSPATGIVPATVPVTSPATVTVPATVPVTSPVTVTVITTQPVTDTTQPPPIGIPPPPTISPNDPGYNASLNFMASLKSTMKLDSSVCNDFYNYSCGAIAGQSFFSQIQLQAIADVVPQLTGNYINNASILPMRQLKWYFEACKVAVYDFAGAIDNGSYVKNLLALMQATTGWNFPALNQGQSPSPVTANSLAAALGFLSGQLNIDTLLSVGIDTNWGNPHSSTPYAMYVDQPVLTYGNSIYRKAWTTYRPVLRNNLIYVMNAAANMYSMTLNQGQLAIDVDAFVDLEYLLATTYSTPDGDRRKFWRMYNNYTIERAGNDFKFIEWITYMQNLTIYANDTVRAKVRDPQFAFIITEIDMTRSLSDDIMNRKSPFTDRLLTNYLYMRYIYDYAGLIPPLPGMEKRHAEMWKAKSVKVASSRVGRLTRRQLRHSEPLVFDTQNNNNRDEVEDQINLECAQDTMFALPYANARAYEDARFPPTFPNPNTPRQMFREKVRYIVESVLTAFRSQIDQLWWMSFASKQGAFGKIDYLVKNIGYPDWINSDNEMIRRHANLLIFEDQPYIAMALVINHWITRADFDLLMRTNGIDRMEFNGPPDLVNAWYQPELNSITFPLAILQPPFFDMNYPWSANFGALGVVGGHELTHGFDDEGVQWDGVGVLSRDGWMDNSSSLAFDDMARCVIQQYGKFCPLNGTSFQPQCIDGVQTQGENIADNGGMRAAYRAYRNHINDNGPDSQLPDTSGVYNQFTHDQLFFLNFGQVWCQRPPSPEALSRQLLLDPHSPALYRVMGSIQNFPAWRSAYNCPNGTSVYAPNDGCQVWASDIRPQQPPPTTTTTPAINVPTLPTSNNTDYSTSVNYFRASMNVSADPCNDFYSYACGSYNKPISFAVVDDINFHNQAVQIKHWELYEYPQTPQALRKTKAFFDACESSHQDYDASIANGSVVLQALSDFAAFTGMTFSMIENQGSTLSQPNSTTLGRAIGWLSDSWVDTLVTGFVDTNWKADDGDAYKVFFDQPSLFWGSLNYYAPDTWTRYTQAIYRSTITNLFQRYAALRGVTLNADTLQRDVQSIMDFEMMLARDFCTDDTTRRKFDRNWNPRTLPNVNTNFGFISWTEYTAALTLSAPAIDFFSRTFIVMEPEKLTNMSRVFMAGTEFTGTQLVNYLFFRLLASQEEFLPDLNKGEQKMERQWQKPLLGAGRRILRTEKKRLPDKATTDQILEHCAVETVDYMMYANARFFIDFLYPTEADRNRTRGSADQIITNILRSFRDMIAHLQWMSDATKVGAYAKVENLQVNIAFPDFIMNNASLDAYYANLVFDPIDGFFSMLKKLQKFNRFLMFDYLNKPAVDRTDFLAPPGIVNAWYQPELNSITFPAGILQTPFFDRLWPSSVNYGGLGLVAGHELTHGFDDQGVQWNGTGILNPWMDQSSADGFQRMADCVIREYSGFCPLNASQYTPNCVNGAQTQGENIADNGGIHASFQSYRRHVSLFGPDLNMPDPLIGQFSHDQLFFLSFGQTWCRAPPSQAAIYRQLMVDVHSPAEFRIFGTIQNFPEFRNTFKCPRGSAYGPNQHCNVWVLDNFPVNPNEDE